MPVMIRPFCSKRESILPTRERSMADGLNMIRVCSIFAFNKRLLFCFEHPKFSHFEHIVKMKEY